MMMNEPPSFRIILTDRNRGWSKVQLDRFHLHFSGYCFEGDARRTPHELAAQLVAIIGVESPAEPQLQQLDRLLHRLNGCFCLIVETPSLLIASVDRLRSIPLFYSETLDALDVTDQLNPSDLDRHPAGLDATGLFDFLHVGYCTGAHTLLGRYRQIESGETVIAFRQTPLRVQRRRYFRYGTTPAKRQLGSSDFTEAFHVALRRSVERLIRCANDRWIIVPLSGGWDSRVIVAVLHHLGARRVRCFAYGPAGHPEVMASRAVASALGFQWQFQDYSPPFWHHWIHSPEARAYWRYSCNMTSLPLFQDLPAARTIFGDGLQPGNSVFVPGHTGDFLSGGHIPAELMTAEKVGLEEIADLVFRKQYYLWPAPIKRGNVHSRLYDRFARVADGPVSRDEAIQLYESWNFEERQAKYIVNSVREYEFLHAGWHLPLWDHELMDLFPGLAPEERFGRRRFIEAVRATLFVGRAAALDSIPIAGANRPPASWIFPTRPHFRFRRIRSCLRQTRFPYLLKRVRGAVRRPQPNAMGFHDWFAGNCPPHRISLRSTLPAQLPMAELVRKAAFRYGHWKLQDLHVLAVLTLHVLSRFLPSEERH